MRRRSFFKTLLGAVVAAVAAPVIPKAVAAVAPKGKYLSAGYIWAPYIPIIVTPTLFTPDDFKPRKGLLLSRFESRKDGLY